MVTTSRAPAVAAICLKSPGCWGWAAMGAGAAGGAVMGVLRDAGAGGGGDECRGAILGGGDAARPRRGIVLKQEMLFDGELAQTQENGDKIR